MYLERYLKQLPDWEIMIINRENYFVYQPMLSEVVGGSIDILDAVSPLHRLLPKCKKIIREIEGIDLEKKEITLSPKFTHTAEIITYDHLVLALGSVTDFKGSVGLHEHAFPFKNLADSLNIRNHLIDVIETASVMEDSKLKSQLLTFVVGGGGFSGTEIVAELNDFVRKMGKRRKQIDPKQIRVILIHKKERLMDRELSESLSRYTEKILKKRGVEIRFGETLQIATPEEAVLGNGERIKSKTIISTVPSSPNPLIETLNLALEKGKIKTDLTFLVEGKEDIWSLGDCARVPLPNGKICPPSAQCAIRQAKALAENIFLTIQRKERKPFSFKSLGVFGALGYHNAVGELFGRIKLSGLFAWFLWRAIYWIKLPGFDRKLKVAFSWVLDAIFPNETIQLKITPTQGIASLHFEPGDVIFREGDVGDYLYIITEGVVEVIRNKEGKPQIIHQLRKGEFFGEIALLNQRKRTATIRCVKPTDVLALRKNDFCVLDANFKELRETFEKTEKERS